MDCFGGCHCGNIHMCDLRLTKPPEDNLLRACSCSLFCRSHNPRMLSDPEGSFEVRQMIGRWLSGIASEPPTCDFLICRRSRVYRRCRAMSSEGVRAVVNVNCLDDRGRFTSVPLPKTDRAGFLGFRWHALRFADPPRPSRCAPSAPERRSAPRCRRDLARRRAQLRRLVAGRLRASARHLGDARRSPPAPPRRSRRRCGRSPWSPRSAPRPPPRPKRRPAPPSCSV